jgi:hypothetical protein
VSGYGLDDRAIVGRSPGEAKKNFRLSSVSRPALGPTQLPVQWVPVVLSGLKSGRGVKVTTHLHLVPRSVMSRSYISSPHKRLYGTALAFIRFYYSVFSNIFNCMYFLPGSPNDGTNSCNSRVFLLSISSMFIQFLIGPGLTPLQLVITLRNPISATSLRFSSCLVMQPRILVCIKCRYRHCSIKLKHSYVLTFL